MQVTRKFISPKIVYGRDALSSLADEVRGKGDKAAIICGKTVLKLGFVEKVANILKGASYEVLVFDEVEPEPSIQTIKKGARMLSKFQPQWIIGLGGGSSMDAGKAMWCLYERPDLTLEAITPKEKLGLRKKARYISIPTTSGTGADVTWAMVITDSERKRKVPFANREVVPDITILDATIPAVMPKKLTARTGLDALVHALEGYTSRWANDFSDGLCLQAIKVIFDWLPRAYSDGSDLKAREKMHNAATIAGLGFGNSNTALAHSLGHAIGATFHLHHGEAVSIALPFTMQFNVKESAEKYADIARFVGIDAKSHEEATKKLILKVKNLAKSVGEPLSLKEAGITEEDLEKNIKRLVDLAASDPSVRTNSRRPITNEEMEKLFRYMFEGKDVDF